MIFYKSVNDEFGFMREKIQINKSVEKLTLSHKNKLHVLSNPEPNRTPNPNLTKPNQSMTFLFSLKLYTSTANFHNIIKHLLA